MTAPTCGCRPPRPALYRITGAGYDRTACDTCYPQVIAAAPVPHSNLPVKPPTEGPQGSLFELGEGAAT